MKDYEIITTDWNGIKLEIRWMPNYLRYDDETTVAHLEVESLSPRRAPLPFTETGYKSHFISEQEVARHGGAIEYVERWLAETSKSLAWKQAAAASNQLSLFLSGSFLPNFQPEQGSMAQDERSPAMPDRKRQAAHKLHLFHAAQDYAASWCLDIDQIAANQWQAGPADKAALVRRDFAGLPLASLNRLLALLFDEIERTMPTAAELRAMCNPVIDPDDPLNDVNVPF